MNKGQNKQLEKYLSQLDSYLRYMPVSEKTDILSELKSTFYERLNNGQSEESIIAAYLSLNGIITDKNVGIVGESIEDTISNIGKLSHEGFSKADDVMLEIINNEKR